MRNLREMLREGDLAHVPERVGSRLESVPTSYYLVGSVASILLSLGMYLTGRRSPSVMIGLWAPMLLLASYFFKQTRHTREI